MINTDGWGRPYLTVRGEILRFVKDELFLFALIEPGTVRASLSKWQGGLFHGGAGTLSSANSRAVKPNSYWNSEIFSFCRKFLKWTQRGGQDEGCRGYCWGTSACWSRLTKKLPE